LRDMTNLNMLKFDHEFACDLMLRL
jgi:hypothetical protein